MLKFNPENPFPLLPSNYENYGEAKLHSEQVDKWLGFNTEKAEALITGNRKYGDELWQRKFMPEYWRGIPVQTIMTPYTEIRSVLHKLKPQKNETVIDLGCGYGRIGFVMGEHYKDVKFIGYEYLDERVQEAQRVLSLKHYKNVSVVQTDLSAEDFIPAVAEYYFMYDFGSRKAIQKTLEDLKQIAKNQKITVVGRGRSSRDTIQREHPWLTDVVPPVHLPQYSFYYSAP